MIKYFDKYLHFGAGVISSAFTQILLTKLHFTLSWTLLLSFIVTFIVAGLKEVRDIKWGGSFDGWDAYWTVAGGLFISIIFKLVV
jgi:hypothetical protein